MPGRTSTRAGVATAGPCAAEAPFRLHPDGGAGFVASAADLVRYVRFHLGVLEADGLPREAAVASAIAGHSSSDPFTYVNGWGAVRVDSETLLISDGQALGASAAILLFPDRGLGVVCLTNQTGGPAVELALAAADTLENGLADRVGGAIAAVEEAIAAPVPRPVGRWRGELDDGAGEPVPVLLDVPADGPYSIAFGGGTPRTIGDPTSEHGALHWTLPASFPFGRGRQHAVELWITLWPGADGIDGVLTETYRDDRPRYGVPYPVRLEPDPTSGEE